jgi:hypothetical protein
MGLEATMESITPGCAIMDAIMSIMAGLSVSWGEGWGGRRARCAGSGGEAEGGWWHGRLGQAQVMVCRFSAATRNQAGSEGRRQQHP